MNLLFQAESTPTHQPSHDLLHRHLRTLHKHYHRGPQGKRTEQRRDGTTFVKPFMTQPRAATLRKTFDDESTTTVLTLIRSSNSLPTLATHGRSINGKKKAFGPNVTMIAPLTSSTGVRITYRCKQMARCAGQELCSRVTIVTRTAV